MLGRVTWGLGRGRGGGGGGRRRERRLVPWIPRPKLIPKWDGMHGVPGDAHLHSEVSLELRLEAGASQSCAGVRVGVVVGGSPK